MASSSEADYIALLNSISNNINAYMSSILFALGVVGSILTLLIFTRQEFRRTPSTIYILTKAIFDMISLLFVISTRAYSGATGIDATRTNEIWCRLRTSLLIFTAFGAFSCIYLTGFDQWMFTSRSVQRRHWSSRRIACYAVLIVLIINILFAGIPIFIMFSPVGTPPVCSYITLSYADYCSFFFFPFVFGVLPIVIPLIFSILTYSNVRLLVRRVSRLEQQLTRMLLLQLLALSIASIPYAVFYFYAAATRRLTKSSLRSAQENLHMVITRNFFQINHVYSFYIFLISSNEMRQILKNLFLRFICGQRLPPVMRSIAIGSRQIAPEGNNAISRTTRNNPIAISNEK